MTGRDQQGVSPPNSVIVEDYSRQCRVGAAGGESDDDLEAVVEEIEREERQESEVIGGEGVEIDVDEEGQAPKVRSAPVKPSREEV